MYVPHGGIRAQKLTSGYCRILLQTAFHIATYTCMYRGGIGKFIAAMAPTKHWMSFWLWVSVVVFSVLARKTRQFAEMSLKASLPQYGP